jgi:molybdate transport system permease protein
VTIRVGTVGLIGGECIGTVLAWSRAVGELGATITFAGNLPGVTQTAPLAIYISQSSGRIDEAIALSLVLVVVSLAVMIGTRNRSRTA